MNATDLPKTREEITLWALGNSTGMHWKMFDELKEQGMLTAIQVILNWVCNDVAMHYPELIKIKYVNKSTTKIYVAGVKVAGGTVPGQVVILFLKENNINVDIVGDEYLSAFEASSLSQAHLDAIRSLRAEQ
jgi:hypothetical protein